MRVAASRARRRADGLVMQSTKFELLIRAQTARTVEFRRVERGYGVCGARDESAYAGQQQQLVDLAMASSPGAVAAKPQLGAASLVPRRQAFLNRPCPLLQASRRKTSSPRQANYLHL